MHVSAAIFGFSLACVFALALTPLVRVLAVRRHLNDLPGPNKIHRVALPLAGGLAIYGALVLAMMACAYAFPDLPGSFGSLLCSVVLAGGLVVVLGLIDDIKGTRPWKKLVTQTLAIVVVQAHLDVLGLRADLPGAWSHALMAILLIGPWILGLTNAMNLIDGLDGLASGVAAASGVGVAALALALGDPGSALVAAMVVGAALGFLRSNAHPAKIFMGDTGSMFLGFVLAVLSACVFWTRPAPLTLLGLVLIMWVPCVDALYAVVRRVATGRSIFRPDQGHIHHRLLAAGMSQRSAGVGLCCLSALGAVAGVQVGLGRQPIPWTAAVLLATLPLLWVLRTRVVRARAAGPAVGEATGESAPLREAAVTQNRAA